MEKTKTHYRKVLKSDHLGTPDLEEMLEEGSNLIFTISNVKQEIQTRVAGKMIDANIAYFKENIKPLVLNATNAKTLRGFAGGSPFVEDWVDITIQLYIDENVKMKGQVVGGVRIKPIQPVLKRIKKPFLEVNFKKAKEAKATIEQIKGVYSITPEMEEKYKNYVG